MSMANKLLRDNHQWELKPIATKVTCVLGAWMEGVLELIEVYLFIQNE